MTPQQMIEFDARREAVLRHQLKTSPKFRAMRRDRRVAFAAGVVRYAVAVGIVLFLIKSFVISQSGVDGYLAMVQPVLEQLPATGLLTMAIAPDQYSQFLAQTFTGLLQTSGQSDNSLAGIETIGPVQPRS